jgi:hypothetical protein
MTQEITQETIRGLSPAQFEQVKGWVRDDDKIRIEKHKQETLAKIRDLARSIEVGVTIGRPIGRPASKSLYREKVKRGGGAVSPPPQSTK